MKPENGPQAVNTVPDIADGRDLSRDKYQSESLMVRGWSMHKVKEGNFGHQKKKKNRPLNRHHRWRADWAVAKSSSPAHWQLRSIQLGISNRTPVGAAGADRFYFLETRVHGLLTCRVIGPGFFLRGRMDRGIRMLPRRSHRQGYRGYGYGDAGAPHW